MYLGVTSSIKTGIIRIIDSPRQTFFDSGMINEITDCYRALLTVVWFSSWNFHLSFVGLVNRIVCVKINLNATGGIYRSMVKPIMHSKLDPANGKQVQLLGRNKLIPGHQPASIKA